MGVGYTAIESAVVARFIELFSTELDATVCAAGDLDGVISGMFSQNREYGCIFEFGGGMQRARAPMNKQIWSWRIYGIFMIRYGDNIEAKLRAIIDKIATAFDPSHARLGGLTPLAELTRLEEADPIQINDNPFYWLPFMVEVIDD